MKRLVIAAIFLIGAVASFATTAAGSDRRIVVILWPGLRPELISADNTPTLYQMSLRGTNFTNHHAVFPSSGNVNCVAIATGTYPATSGLVAETEYRPDIDPLTPVLTSEAKTLQIGDARTQNRYLKTPTIAELLRSRLPPLYTDCAGTEIATLLFDREDRKGSVTSTILAAGNTLPTPAVEDINKELGIFPSITNNNETARDTWTTAALASVFWEANVPTLSILNLAEPDYTASLNGPGSYPTMETILLCDEKLAMILTSLQKRGQLEDTDVIVLSSHGMTSASKRVDLAADLIAQGIKAQKYFAAPPVKGSVLVVENGGSASIYITGHDADATAKIVAALAKLDYVGTIFTRDSLTGTFPLSLAKIDSAAAPDIALSYRWTDETTGNLRGKTPSADPGKSVCGSLSPYDMRAAMIAYGPDFGKGKTDSYPTGNIDLAPTILWILGIDAPKSMNGRVLAEAMNAPGLDTPKPETTRMEVKMATPGGERKQYLKISKVGATEYIDEGNATLE
jgi:predicted AlkP superfamily pyrophosphatase or phosphodiesterase